MMNKLHFQKEMKLPIKNFRDLINMIRQDLKFKYFPFKLYYNYRAKKYAKNKTIELNLIKYLCNKNFVSLDIGANLGLFIFFLQKYSKRVLAFEPNPYPLRYLYGLVDKNVEIHPIAIGNRNKKVDLFIPKSKKGWSSNGASLNEKELNLGIKFSVECKKIDSLNIEKIGLIKIDVEGHEMQVIEGAKNTLIQQQPNLIIENEIVHQKDTSKLFEQIKDYGYEIFYAVSYDKMKKISKFSDIRKLQKFPNLKRIGYIQNFICIHKDKISNYQQIII